jgi:hypothetical protein
MEFISGLVSVPLDYRLDDALGRQGLQFESWVGPAAASFATKMPIPPSAGVFNSEGYFRLERHRRSICFAPQRSEPIRGVFCIKGMEPLAPDFGCALDQLAARHTDRRGLNGLEHYVLFEDKLPGCLLSSEAHAEASIAATVHKRLADDGDPLARLPLPALCVQLPQATAAATTREICKRASRNLWHKIEMLAAGGLGAYVYWYPSVPLRANQVPPARRLAVSMSEGWIKLAARLLRAGFLPTTAHSWDRGHCCDRNNAVIDGGFADLGSVVPVTELSAPADVFVALQLTISLLTATILCVFGKHESQTGRFDFDYVANTVLHLVRERLMRACGKDADPRMMEFFDAAKDISAVVRLLEKA